MIKVQESPPNIMITRKPVVCESPSKRLIIQGKDISPRTWGKLHCCLIIFLFQVSICNGHDNYLMAQPSDHEVIIMATVYRI